MKRSITIKLTKDEADSLLVAGNAGIADLIDAQDDESLETANSADKVLDKIGQAYSAAWPDAEPLKV